MTTPHPQPHTMGKSWMQAHNGLHFITMSIPPRSLPHHHTYSSNSTLCAPPPTSTDPSKMWKARLQHLTTTRHINAHHINAYHIDARHIDWQPHWCPLYRCLPYQHPLWHQLTTTLTPATLIDNHIVTHSPHTNLESFDHMHRHLHTHSHLTAQPNVLLVPPHYPTNIYVLFIYATCSY